MADKGEALPFASRIGGNATGEEAQDAPELVAPGDIYATVTGQRQALNLEFVWRDGRSLCVPYACLPLIWWHPPGLLTLEYPSLFSVVLRGKELDELHRRIRDHRVTWVREFDEHQAAGLACAVTHIDILRFYPSREAGDDPAAGT